MALGLKLVLPSWGGAGEMFYIAIYRKNLKKIFSQLQFKPVERIQALLGLLFLALLAKGQTSYWDGPSSVVRPSVRPSVC